jgi:hypothetical protein
MLRQKFERQNNNFFRAVLESNIRGYKFLDEYPSSEVACISSLVLSVILPPYQLAIRHAVAGGS